MSDITTLYAQQYSTNIQLLLQQKGSKFRGAVMEGAHVGTQASPVDQIGAVDPRKVTGRFQPMGRVDAPYDRRWVFPQPYDLPQLKDQFDQMQMVSDPNSSLVINGVYAMGRGMDDQIIASFFGTSKTGVNGGTSTTFPAAQQVAVNFGAAAAGGLTVEKLLEAQRLLMAAEVDLDNERINVAISAKQHKNLLDEIQIVSTDYNMTPVLSQGLLKRWGLFDFIHSERLDVDGSSYRRVPVWVKSGMYLGVWSDIQTSISKRNDLQGEPWQAYCIGNFGGTRLEEAKIVEIKCSEA